MKILVCGDVHWSSYSSILRKQGMKYTKRLENLIQTINWVESQAEGCSLVVYLGDFFDKSSVSDIETTALRQIKWAEHIPHYFIVGNHESSVDGLRYNSTKVLERDNFKIISEPLSKVIVENGMEQEFVFIPYILDENRKQLSEYCENGFSGPRVVFSHNDLKGISFGPIVSKTGFDLDDINNNCDLFINGHLHNGSWINKKTLNLGNITGQNFSEDASKYSHTVLILDTSNLKTTFIENPFAYNFYKFEINSSSDISCLDNLKPNSVISVKCVEELADQVKEKLGLAEDYRIVTFKKDNTKITNNLEESFTVGIDYLEKFKEFIINTLENSDTLQEELMEVCK